VGEISATHRRGMRARSRCHKDNWDIKGRIFSGFILAISFTTHGISSYSFPFFLLFLISSLALLFFSPSHSSLPCFFFLPLSLFCPFSCWLSFYSSSLYFRRLLLLFLPPPPYSLWSSSPRSSLSFPASCLLVSFFFLTLPLTSLTSPPLPNLPAPFGHPKLPPRFSFFYQLLSPLLILLFPFFLLFHSSLVFTWSLLAYLFDASRFLSSSLQPFHTPSLFLPLFPHPPLVLTPLSPFCLLPFSLFTCLLLVSAALPLFHPTPLFLRFPLYPSPFPLASLYASSLRSYQQDWQGQGDASQGFAGATNEG